MYDYLVIYMLSLLLYVIEQYVDHLDMIQIVEDKVLEK
jgi:hypothetical protein